ncbi:hypothetical protein MTO96_010543 [Rhipicephalus appendiculatus]
MMGCRVVLLIEAGSPRLSLSDGHTSMESAPPGCSSLLVPCEDAGLLRGGWLLGTVNEVGTGRRWAGSIVSFVPSQDTFHLLVALVAVPIICACPQDRSSDSLPSAPSCTLAAIAESTGNFRKIGFVSLWTVSHLLVPRMTRTACAFESRIESARRSPNGRQSENADPGPPHDWRVADMLLGRRLRGVVRGALTSRPPRLPPELLFPVPPQLQVSEPESLSRASTPGRSTLRQRRKKILRRLFCCCPQT